METVVFSEKAIIPWLMETVVFSEKAIIPFTDAIKVWMQGEKYLVFFKIKFKKILKKKLPY